MSAPEPDPSDSQSRFPLVQREITLLLVLCVIAVGLFAMTRKIAAWSRRVEADAAADWYTRGTAAQGRGDAARALAAFRRAASGDRDNQPYQLALARALAESGDRDEASQILLRLRDASPDAIEVNYRLARLAADEGQFDDAVRYYNHALYGIARGGVPLERYRIRMELITLLINHGDLEDARDELGALTRELPADPAAARQAADLAARLAPPPPPAPPPQPASPDVPEIGPRP